jgi:hypothetical protein
MTRIYGHILRLGKCTEINRELAYLSESIPFESQPSVSYWPNLFIFLTSVEVSAGEYRKNEFLNSPRTLNHINIYELLSVPDEILGKICNICKHSNVSKQYYNEWLQIMTIYWAYDNKFQATFSPFHKPIILPHHVRLDVIFASNIVLQNTWIASHFANQLREISRSSICKMIPMLKCIIYEWKKCCGNVYMQL